MNNKAVIPTTSEAAASIGASDGLRLDDLDLSSLALEELNEETLGHPENLASTKWCCCCLSTLPPFFAS